jgi:hypothetical protein
MNREASPVPVLVAPRRPALTLLLLGGLYVYGLVHWTLFIGAIDVWPLPARGGMIFSKLDWPKEYLFYSVLRDAVRDGRAPLHVSEPVHETDRFLALPETVLSPQVLFLPLFEGTPAGIGRWLCLHAILLYTVGFAGCLLIRRRYGLSLVPFAFLCAAFLFNGHITAHLTAGHSMWFGYYLLPFFALFLMDLVQRQDSFVPALELSMVLFLMMLQGSFHMVVWCWMFLAILAAFHPHYGKQVLVAIGASAMLTLFRLAPAALTFWSFKDYPLIPGYQALGDMLNGFTTLRERQQFVDFPRFVVGWWEYDLYMGLVGFGVFVYFGLLCRPEEQSQVGREPYRVLLAPVAALALFSFGDLFALISGLPVPLVNGERVPSRFLLVPMVIVLVIAVVRLDEHLRGRPARRLETAAWWAAVVYTFFTTAHHSLLWCIPRLESDDKTVAWLSFQPVEIVDRDEPIYTAVVVASLAMSLAALAAWGYFFACARRAEGDLAPTSRVL